MVFIDHVQHAKDVAKAAEENSAREKEMIALRQVFLTFFFVIT